MEELKKYFTNLLILQYRNKPRAKATVEALTENAFSNTTGKIFPIEVQNSYNLDTATGKQLDILGKYLGKDRVLAFAIDNTFKYATYDLSSDPNTGYNDYQEEVTSYPYAEYRYSQYSYETIGDKNYRKILKMLAFLRGKPLTLENIDLALESAFDGYIYAIEKPKEIEYHVAQGFFPLLTDQDRLDTAFKKYFPKPMGCSISAVRDPMFLNLIPYGGAENYVDENFIFKRESGDSSIFLETPNKFSFSSNDAEPTSKRSTIEIQTKVKINSDYESSGFWATFKGGDCTDSSLYGDWGLYKRRVTSSFTMMSGNNNPISLFSYTAYTDQWVIIKMEVSYDKFSNTSVHASLIVGGVVVAETDTSWGININSETIVYGLCAYGGFDSFIGSIDFKECYIKINNNIVWQGVTNKRVKGV